MSITTNSKKVGVIQNTPGGQTFRILAIYLDTLVFDFYAIEVRRHCIICNCRC